MLQLGAHTMKDARRRAALALGGLLVASLLGAQAHRVVALHAVCSRHGELIHVDGGEPHAPARPAAEAFAAGTTVALEGVHGCAALLFLATALVGPAPAEPVVALRAEPARAAAKQQSATPHPIPLLFQAPKHSPPVA